MHLSAKTPPFTADRPAARLLSKEIAGNGPGKARVEQAAARYAAAGSG